MIIKYPTGYYRTILPKEGESGNVTYTISSNQPPRASLVFPKLPAPLSTGKSFSAYTQAQRRAAVGQLIYTSTSNTQNEPTSSVLRYESGQLLDFNTNPNVPVVSVDVSPLLIRHDTNAIDLQSAGVDGKSIEVSAATAIDKLTIEYKAISASLLSLSANLDSVQKSLNEAVRASSALSSLLSVDNSQPIIDAFNAIQKRVVDLTNDKTNITSNINALNADLASKRNSIISLASLVR